MSFNESSENLVSDTNLRRFAKVAKMDFKPEELCPYYVPVFKSSCQHCGTDVFTARYFKKKKVTCHDCRKRIRKEGNARMLVKRSQEKSSPQATPSPILIDNVGLVVK